MYEEIIERLENHYGPFTDKVEDQVLLDQLMAWLDSDFDKLRLLLNYVGELASLRTASAAAGYALRLKRNGEFRVATEWKPALGGSDIVMTGVTDDCKEDKEGTIEILF